MLCYHIWIPKVLASIICQSDGVWIWLCYIPNPFEMVGPMHLTKRLAMCCHLSGQPFNKHMGGMRPRWWLWIEYFRNIWNLACTHFTWVFTWWNQKLWKWRFLITIISYGLWFEKVSKKTYIMYIKPYDLPNSMNELCHFRAHFGAYEAKVKKIQEKFFQRILINM
jgi:hypothetical protein